MEEGFAKAAISHIIPGFLEIRVLSSSSTKQEASAAVFKAAQ